MSDFKYFDILQVGFIKRKTNSMWIKPNVHSWEKDVYLYTLYLLIVLTLSSLNLPLSSSSTTSRELLSQFSTCSGWRWFEVGEQLQIGKPVSWGFSFLNP